jgi:hypothetical protein
MENGLQSVNSEQFHKLMRKLYKEQHQSQPLTDANQYHVQAKLPAPLYREFQAVLKKNGWSITTGIQYAIHELSQQKEQAS